MTYHRVGESARVSLLSGSTDEYIECYSYLIDNNNGWLIFSKDSKKDFEMILRRGRNDT